jgi:hypothetical protein
MLKSLLNITNQIRIKKQRIEIIEMEKLKKNE